LLDLINSSANLRGRASSYATQTPVAATKAPRKTFLLIGGIGLFLVVIGVAVGIASDFVAPLPLILLLVGALLMVYALATGNVKVF